MASYYNVFFLNCGLLTVLRGLSGDVMNLCGICMLNSVFCISFTGCRLVGEVAECFCTF